MDCFVCGLANEGIQKRILSEANLDFEKAVQIARGMEAAQKSSQVVKVSERLVQKVQDHDSSRAQGGPVCSHCGKKKHQTDLCHFKNAVCYRCHKKGHIEAKCKAKQGKEELKWMDKQGEDESRGRWYHIIDTLCEGTVGSLFKSQGTLETNAYIVKMEINGEMLMMEIDKELQCLLFPKIPIRKSFPNYCWLSVH